MALVQTSGSRIAGICTSVPMSRFDNVADTVEFTETEVRKVTGLAGVSARRIAGDSVCSSDLCVQSSERLLQSLGWSPDSVDALIMVTQTPDYILPSTSCVIHKRLGLSDRCAAFDVGLGCSGYPYGLWLGAMMIQSGGGSGGIRRVLVLHGETPTRFSDRADRSVSLLFGDAGSATALEATPAQTKPWYFALHTDGRSYDSMIIESGGFRNRFDDNRRNHCVSMDGALIFNFTIKRVPALIEETLTGSGHSVADIDYFIFHQSNQFIMKHLCSKQSLPVEKVPLTLKDFGNTGGVSIPLTITRGELMRPRDKALRLMLLGYGVGLSWGSALLDLDSDAVLESLEYDNLNVASSQKGE
jgi:3-oxoacyl-[acyl-carrier-protein] synthase-3